MWFNFEGTIAKFDIRKFEAITGLNCDSLPIVDISKVKEIFLSKYFKNEDLIPRSRVSFLFNDSKKLKDEDKVKMAKIYFLENFLLGKQFTTGIDSEHIKLVDDEKYFDAYPWDRIRYNALIDPIKNSIKKTFLS